MGLAQMWSPYSPEVIRTANATARGAWGHRKPLVYAFAARVMAPADSVLDFGAGPRAVFAGKLREQGFRVTAWDFGGNFIEGAHDRSALLATYDTILVSNVFNVLDRVGIVCATAEIVGCLGSGGQVIWNFPADPHKYVGVDESYVVAEFASYGYVTVSPYPRLFVSGVPDFLMS